MNNKETNNAIEKQYGLIGYPLSHSFSQQYFTDKFEQENIANAAYGLFPIEDITQLPSLIEQHPTLVGLNVTIPYKQAVIPYLDQLDAKAKEIGAVNTIRIDPATGYFTGFNTDYYGFQSSLQTWLGVSVQQALVLGTGGASKAVVCALRDMGISYTYISRRDSAEMISYETLKKEHHLQNFPLIINTTPLGMTPRTETFPDLAYDQITDQHFCYDLVYNPAETAFMQQAKAQGAQVKNGLEMLHLQAEKSWEIWNQVL